MIKFLFYRVGQHWKKVALVNNHHKYHLYKNNKALMEKQNSHKLLFLQTGYKYQIGHTYGQHTINTLKLPATART